MLQTYTDYNLQSPSISLVHAFTGILHLCLSQILLLHNIYMVILLTEAKSRIWSLPGYVILS